MFRSLLVLLLITGLGAETALPAKMVKSFDPVSELEVQVIPQKRENAIAPVILARSALLMDVDTGIALYQKNPEERMPMASLTKIMTAILILDSHKLSEVVTVQDDFSEFKDLGVRIWLQQYEKLTVGDLLIGLLVPSAGDAAMALAKYHSGSVEKFVEAMNNRARELHLSNTHFKNPIGLDEEGHYSTAYDLAMLTRYALKNADFRRIVQLSEASITSTNGQTTHSFKSTDELLGGYLDIRGVKTGTTDEAGQSVINLARNANGKEVLSVILDSPSRFQESKSLIDWSFRNYLW
jgi:serine-type D-Ala-D-Ala carboxypeptidase (penicillin-binding protein 5/6)